MTGPCRCPATKEVEQQKAVINSLNAKILEMRNCWNAQYNAMMKEKADAMNAAKFATQKLVESVKDFENQVNTQQKVQKVLTDLLRDKDERIKSAVMQVPKNALIFY